jgi:hypothetical protein
MWEGQRNWERFPARSGKTPGMRGDSYAIFQRNKPFPSGKNIQGENDGEKHASQF